MNTLGNKTLRHIKKTCQQSLFALILSQSLFSQSFAQSTSIKIAGLPVFSVPAATGTDATKRAATVQEHLDDALVAAKDRTPTSVNIAYVNGMPVVTLGGYQVVTVTTQDAVASKTTPALLANQWADKIRAALVDQASVNAYVAQLSDTYTATAPPPRNDTNAGANTAPYSPNLNQNQAQYSGNQVVGNSQTPPNASNWSQPSATNYGGNNSHSYDSYNVNANNNNNNPAYAQQSPPSGYQAGTGQGQGYRQGRIAYAQVGQIIPVTLNTSIATQVARAGDLIQATISQNVTIGDSTIPSGTLVLGQVTDAKSGGRLTRSGELQIKFTRLRLPDGSETPINAHIVGTIGKYAEVGGDQSDEFKGETMKNKVGSVAFRGLLGAGGGAALGTAVGAIAGGGHGAGMGAWSGAAIGGGLGAADSLILRKGKDVTVPSGTNLKLQLDSPVAISGVTPFGY